MFEDLDLKVAETSPVQTTNNIITLENCSTRTYLCTSPCWTINHLPTIGC